MCGQSKQPQKPHRKSRLGCQICKARKVKCDEVRPICGNCVRRFPNPELECTYEPPTPSASRSVMGSPASSLSSPFPHAGTAPPRSLELRLFHHYGTVTCHTMPMCEEACGVQWWTKAIPTLAFEHEYICNAILGLAAMHLLSLTPDDNSLEVAVLYYIHATISHHREALSSSQITRDNFLPLFATSILICQHAKFRAVYLKAGNADAPYSLPLNWMYIHHGCCELYQATEQYTEGSDIRAYACTMAEKQPPELPPPANPPRDFKFPDDPLYDLISTTTAYTSERMEIYTQSLVYLSIIKTCIERGEKAHWIHRRISAMPSRIPREFVGLLEEEDPLALGILARYFALAKVVDAPLPWWLEGTPEFEVWGLAGMVGEQDRWVMEWPLMILESV